MEVLRWIFALLLALTISQCVYVLLYCATETQPRREEKPNTLQLLRCAKLREKFSVIKPARSLMSGSFTQDLSDLTSCSYQYNSTEKERSRLRLHFCCNATGLFFLTKHNTAVNQKIRYEKGQKFSYKVGEALHRLLPEDLPWSSRSLGRCAVVGSSGILTNSSCGHDIDSADFVIRFNLASVNNCDVGLKTDLVTVNPSQIRAEYRDLQRNPGPLVERVSVYGNATLIVPAFAFVYNTQPSIMVLKVLRSHRPHQPVVFFSSTYLRTLDRFWKARGLKEIRLSTGFMLISMAMELCEHVHVYGFWPFPSDLQQRPVPYHYYDRKTASRIMHAMPEEFVWLLHLHSQGALILHLQPCNAF